MTAKREDKPTKRVVESPGGFYGREIYEQIQARGGSGPAYALCNLDTGDIRLAEGLEVGQDEVHVPLSRCLWPLPDRPREYEDEASLYQEILTFLKDHLVLSDSRLYDVLACFILASWRPEQFRFATYLLFLGPPESGKTRGLELLLRLCYRPYHVVTPTPAVVFRMLDKWGVTLLMDEVDKVPGETMREIAGVIDAGYKKDGYVPRAEPSEDGGYVIRNFKVYGFKALAAIMEPTATIVSRCVLFSMMKNPEPVPLFIDEDQAQDLRSKLLMYRFRQLTSRPGQPDFTGWKSSRVAEIFCPLLQVAPTAEAEERLRGRAKRIMFTRAEEERASEEARVLTALLEVKDERVKGRIATRFITSKFNEDLPEREQVSSDWVGRRMRSMGFERTRMPTRTAECGWFWDEDLITRLQARYRLIEEAEEGVTPVEAPEGSKGSEEKPKLSPVSVSSESSEGSTEVYPPSPAEARLSSAELLQVLRSRWQRGTNEEFEALITEVAGFSRDEARSLRERLLDEGRLAYDPDGWLVWV